MHSMANKILVRLQINDFSYELDLLKYNYMLGCIFLVETRCYVESQSFLEQENPFDRSFPEV